MGCMPYGPDAVAGLQPSLAACFNPSYGLHALRADNAGHTGSVCRGRCFNPSYGLHALRALTLEADGWRLVVSIPHMGCMPYGPGPNARIALGLDYGFNPSYGLHALRAWSVSESHRDGAASRFNPSYGLHALRALAYPRFVFSCCGFQSLIWVACPTGGWHRCIRSTRVEFQSLIWVACPTGAWNLLCFFTTNLFQSLIWVACPTGNL